MPLIDFVKSKTSNIVTATLMMLVRLPGAAAQLMDAAALVVRKSGPAPLAKCLDGLSGAMKLLEPNILLESLMQMTQTVATAIVHDAKHVFIIRDGMRRNELTAATIQFLWDQRRMVTSFMIDVVECAKCYVKADSVTGVCDPLEEHGHDNELDLWDPMNRHALLCQAQRLVKSIVFILTNAARPLAFDDIDMTKETRLCTDNVDLGLIIEVTPSGRQKVSATSDSSAKNERRDSAVGELDDLLTGQSKRAANGHFEASPISTPGEGTEDPAKVTDEKWFFVNGIGTELYWLHLACRKLAKRYSRNVTGVYNRGDGILWDLIKCAGQRNSKGQLNVKSQKEMVQTAKGGQMAQMELANQLEAALLTKGERGHAYKKVVMIAHSQGCLVLRLALEDLRAQRSKALDEAMRERLCVFTFGNPSVDWLGEPDDVLRTEHFGNEKDFVAHLGVFHDGKPKDRGYKNLFTNKEEGWVGHLFGAQYSLDCKHYTDEFEKRSSKRSWLLNCRQGEPLAAERVSSA
ncbi:hypothetical protein BK809_0000372 [Diplodia seriata]|uniref:DUF676 domain-containing protein n=1 Tax=Diplodia seriata TaxID=420778 RepID=A0A1S8BA55_9PEZI|nr:hypothetical protein BK809_0000372 [Diplodia seriata]